MFKLESETPTHYIVKHPKGDVLKIAKHGLSQELHKHIKKMASGGMVDDDSSDDSSQPQQQAPVVVNVGTGPQQQSNPVGPEQLQVGPQQQDQNNPQLASPIPINEGNQPEKKAEEKQGFQNVPLPAIQNQPVQSQGNPAGPSQGYLGTLQQIGQQYQGATNQYAEAQGNIGQGQAEAMQNFQDQTQQVIDNFNKTHQFGMDQMQKIQKEMATQKYDFNHAWQSKSRGDKVLAGIGMILAGAGSGLTGQPNLAWEILNKEMERDIREQIANNDKKKTAFGMYNNILQNDSAAAKMSLASIQTATMAKLNQVAGENQGPLARSRAQMANLEFQQQINKNIYEGSMNQAIMKAQMTNPGSFENGQEQSLNNQIGMLRVLKPEAAKEMEARYLPGIGMANIPVEQKDREEISARTNLDNKLSALEDFAKKHSGSFNPAIVNQGKTLAQDAQDAYRQANNQGVFREAEKNFVEKMITTDPTKFWGSTRTLPHYKQLRQSNRDTIINKLKSLGINNYQMSNLTPRDVYGSGPS